MTIFIEIWAPATFILSKQINSHSMIAQELRDAGKITEQSFSTLQRLRPCCFSTVPGKDELCQAGITTYQNTKYVVMSWQHIWEVLSVCRSIGNHGKSHLELLFGLFSGTLQWSPKHTFPSSFLLFILHIFVSPYISPICGLDGYLFSPTHHQQQTINKLQKVAGNMSKARFLHATRLVKVCTQKSNFG